MLRGVNLLLVKRQVDTLSGFSHEKVPSLELSERKYE